MSVGILNGIRVLDLTRMTSGACCTMILADHGAEVIKIEVAPGRAYRGQDRHAPDGRERNPTEAARNCDRNKKSVALDLQNATGRNAFAALVGSADTVVEDFSAGAMDEFGLGYETLVALNPALVYAALGEESDPHHAQKPGGAESARAATMCFGILAALRHAEATGEGQCVEFGADGALPTVAGDRNPTPTAGTTPDQPLERSIATPLRFSAIPAPAPQTPPAPGRDTDHYLSEMPPVAMTDPEKRALRDVLGTFATGVTVITTRQGDGMPRGFTANSFTSVSLDPPMVLVCIGKTAHSCDVFKTAEHFAVNVLGEDQKDVSNLFAARSADKFAQCAWQGGTADMPLLSGALAEIVCKRHRLVDAGDHVILLGQVIDFLATSGRPLGFYKGNYFSIGVEDDLVAAAAQNGAVMVGALLLRGRQILLREMRDGTFEVPTAPVDQPSPDRLKAHLAKLGVKANLDFLYAVYQDSRSGRHGIFYRGTAEGIAHDGHRFIDIARIPFDSLRCDAERSMLARFADEFRQGAFGIYQGDERSGTIHRVAAPG